MPHITTHSGIDWHYDIEGKGEHLLFLHGWGVDKRIWRQQAKFFSQYYRVMTIDLPGHGKSSWKKMALEGMARDLRTILQALQFNDISVVGSSLGGLVALKLYEKFPHGIKRLVFVGSMPKFSRSAGYPHGLDVEKMRKLGGQLDSDYPSIVNVFFRSLFTKEERQSRRFKWLQKFRQSDAVPMKQALVDYLDILEQEDLREVLKTVHVPIQFINGRDDEICTKETVEFLRKSCPGSRFDFFEQCGHFPFLSKPYEFNQVVEEFLKSSTL
ncbi:MAG: alpha/beta fold hydrolase [Candidatus Omnitrophica bacterium]|nr:alpha/beta fold hydrolase [Candidatus Omnitrophota bacterium]